MNERIEEIQCEVIKNLDFDLTSEELKFYNNINLNSGS